MSLVDQAAAVDEPAAPLPPSSPGRTRWERPALAGLLLGASVLHLWGLSASGWANSFYAAAVQAGSVSWRSFFFVAADAGNSISIDKTPLSLWVMALSARLFGMNSWSMLAPQAVMGVASTALVYATVRRWFTPAAALLAGAVMALTPVAVVMFRFNNPDALLTLLLIGSVYAIVRALEQASTRWVLLGGVLVGLAFLTKMLQAFLVLPALVLVYLVCAPTSMRRRLVQLLGAFAAMVVAGGWWVAAIELIPASARPYVGGSEHNSLLELVFGFNGLGRLNGDEAGGPGGMPGGGGGPGGGMWGATGALRMFQSGSGGQVSWLLPAALVLLVAGLWLRGRSPRTDRLRAAYLLWGGYLLVHLVVFSFMAGIYHDYYTITLAPGIAALVGMGVTDLWRIVDPTRRGELAAVLLAVILAGTVTWAWVLWGRSPQFYPVARAAVIFFGLLLAVAVAAMAWLRTRFGRRVAAVVVGASVLAALAGPAAYSLQTVSTGHRGSIPTAGPPVAGASGPFARGGPGGAARPGPPGGDGLQTETVDAALVAALRQDASSFTWVAAAVGSQAAAGPQLATGLPVMSIGGFGGNDPSPTLAAFQEQVAQKRIHYFISGGGGPGGGGPGGGGGRSGPGGSASSQISAWVQATFPAARIGSVTVHDLTRAAS
ncbi:MAG: glycosyltransferase family 39 protein [Kineosporiaceae bacterium]|nr:glycosyltransferase family 39 protein [Kineosporiaceae bacterium]MBK8074724.1 glycosyltransferase family 39 protein [Kineosporiaceae bacterium]